MLIVSPLSGSGCGTPSKWPKSMAYKWGLILTTYPSPGMILQVLGNSLKFQHLILVFQPLILVKQTKTEHTSGSETLRLFQHTFGKHTPKPLPTVYKGIPFIVGERGIAVSGCARTRGAARNFLGETGIRWNLWRLDWHVDSRIDWGEVILSMAGQPTPM